MCGIAGAIWDNPELSLNEARLRKMTELLAHRGPDDEGHYRSDYLLRPPYDPIPGIALGARRLSIIDLAGGHQPLSNEDGTVWVVLNGEIYNYRELRQRLEGAGHVFRTNSDTETLVHLYEDEGTDFARHLVGMFAIAIWDQSRRRLVLVRDRLGQKPLVYCQQPGRLLFASELKALLSVPGVSTEVDPSALDEYLAYQYVPYPNTIFEGIRKLPPAHVAVYSDDQLSVSRYWEPDWNHEVAREAGEYCRQLQDRLTEAVKLRMRSDVPLGAFLSGGIDSSVIVALMQQNSDRPIKTFSIGFPQPEYDETRFANAVAQHLGTDHQQLTVDGQIVDLLPQWTWHFDEPFADSSAIATWYVSQLARQQVTVALTGDGGDELFAGYARYQAIRLGGMIDRLPRPIRSALGSRVWQRIPGSRRRSVARRLKRFTEPLLQEPPHRYLEWIAIFNEAARGNIYQPDFLERLPDSDPVQFIDRIWRGVHRRDPVTTASVVDLQTYLCSDLMNKVDIASMAHSLECRQPLLDHRVVELAMQMPIGLKMSRGRGKAIFRRAFGALLPSEVLRRRKMGFGVPLDHWFRHELRDFAHEVLTDSTARGRGYFRHDFVAQLLDEHARNDRDHSDRLWSLLVLELWHRQWVDQRPS